MRSLWPGGVVSGGFVEAGGQFVGEAVAVVGVAAPAGGVVPFPAVAGGIYVDGDDDGLLDGVDNLAGEFVGSAYAFLQGDVFFFGDQELGVVAFEQEVFHHGSGNFAVVLVLAEASVGRAFAGGVSPMAVPVNLEEDGCLVPGHAQKVFLHQSFDGVEADV